MNPLNGTLALVGSGEYLPRTDPVDRWLMERLPDAPRVVCLPTAAGTEGEAVVARWAELGVAHFRRLGARAESVPVVDRASASDESLVERIHRANFVYLSGGKPHYLHDTLRSTPAWAAILGVLERGGVVAGCSAGAMIMGAAIPRFRVFTPLQPGFNLLPNAVIMPHFDEFPAAFGKTLQLAIGERTLLGVEGYTALVATDSTYRVVGAGGVTVWNRRGKARYTHSQDLTWPHDSIQSTTTR